MEANVQNFLKKAADVVGEYHRGWFYEEYRCQFNDDHVVDSPIEQLFYCAIHALREINYIKISEEGSEGLGIIPQCPINVYKVDFFISYHKMIKSKAPQLEFENKYKYKMYTLLFMELKKVIVECDSQIFHERTESERRYEKKRDRDLTRLGYKVFHFTGKEITDNPYLPAKEVLEYLCESDIEMP